MEFREPVGQLIHDPREFTKDVSFPDPRELRIYDDTLRDGEQMPGICYTPEQKLEIAKRLSDIGVHIMDIGFPAAAKGDQRTLQLLAQAKRRGDLRDDLELVVMCRSNPKDIDVTLAALDEVGVAPREVTFFVFTSGSDLHLKYKIGKTLLHHAGKPDSEWLETPVSWYRAENLELHCEAIRYARAKGVERVEFGGEDGSRGDVDYFIELFRRGLEAGGVRPAWPDTVGTLTPEATRWYCSRIVEAIGPDVTLLNHFHNDYGLAAINCITSLASGFKAFTVTANGYGERAGNVPLHQVVTALRVLYGVDIPGFKYHQLRDLARFMEEMSGVPMQLHEPIVGMSVFSHESGIHTQGMLIDRRIYEAVPAELVGAEMHFVYGKHSGAALVEHALRKHEARLAEVGVACSHELALRVTEEVKRLREERAQRREAAVLVHRHRAALAGLGLSEEEVIAIAQAIGRPAHTAG
ncbi:MAG: hypothetical protein KGM44_05875 [bacterium]|nr:hypothetical protein [bacterium]